MQHGDDTFEDFVMNFVIVLLNMLSSLMKFGVAQNRDDNLVVTIYRHTFLRDNTHISNKRMKSYHPTRM